MLWTVDPVAAARYPDPYPSYAGLARGRSFARDEGLGMWVAASAEAVGGVLRSEACRVRPAKEPVPTSLVGTTAGELFGRMVRMTDGEAHAPLKRAVTVALATVDPDEVASMSAVWAATLWERDALALISARVTAVAFNLSTHVVGDLLGLPHSRLGDVARWMGDFVHCLAPASTAEQVADGIRAAERLAALVADTVVHSPDGPDADGLLAALLREMRQVGITDETGLVANAVGFLSQAYEATAGLIGNTILALGADVELCEGIVRDPDELGRLVVDTLHRDPPIQSTRRFVGRDEVVMGLEVREGEVVLVLLAAANHDLAVSRRSTAPQPVQPNDRERGRDGSCGHGVSPWPPGDGGFSLGVGAHACPGGAIAVTVAEAAVRQVMAAGVSLPELAASFAYRPSANARVPLFGEREVSA